MIGKSRPAGSTPDGRLFEKAARRGLNAAQVNLGFAYLDGNGVEKNVGKAAHWFYKAASHGLPIAQYVMGGMYAEGKGVKQDSIEALKWLRLAQQGDYAPAAPKGTDLEKTMTQEQIRQAEKQIAAFKSAR